MFSIEYNSNSKKFLKKSEKKTAKRIMKKLEGVRKDPFRYLQHYEGDSCYKLRIGDFRALIDVDPKKKVLHVRVLDKRGRIYKRH